VLVDAHFHADDLCRYRPDFASWFAPLPDGASHRGLASCHDAAGYQATLELQAAAGARWLVSFGLHPQLPVLDELPLLTRLAESGSIAAIGEAGFDFFGDRPERLRNPANLERQRQAFEAQLELAIRQGLPMVLHLRKASDIIFQYSSQLSRLPGFILHGWSGPANEAASLLQRCPRACFSFGTGLLNGNRKAAACVARLPATALLTESDAPYQPPRAAPKPGAAIVRAWSEPADVLPTLALMAAIRGCDCQQLEERIETNFKELFRL